MLFVQLVMRWAEHSLAQELRAANEPGAKPGAKAATEHPGSHPDRASHNSCPQCVRDMAAKLVSAERGATVPSYSPDACPYQRALFRDLARLLAQDSDRLAEWHRRAVERYRDHDM
jgi:hypothetical protein